MRYRITFILPILVCLLGICSHSHAQEITPEEDNNPVILYSITPKKYEIGGIKVEGTFLLSPRVGRAEAESLSKQAKRWGTHTPVSSQI